MSKQKKELLVSFPEVVWARLPDGSWISREANDDDRIRRNMLREVLIEPNRALRQQLAKQLENFKSTKRLAA